MKHNFKLHPNETPSAAITRLYKYIRTIERSYTPQSRVEMRIQNQKAMKSKLRIVK